MRLIPALLCGFCGLMAQEPWRTATDKGNQLREEGRCREAIPVLAQARTLAKQRPEEREGVAITTNNLGAAYLCVGQYTKAEQAFQEALRMLDASGVEELRVAITNNLGVLLIQLGKWAAAESVLGNALALTEALYGGDHPRTAIAVHSLAVTWLQRGFYARARELLRRALAILEMTAGEHAHTAVALNNLGVTELYLKEYGQARAHTWKALEIRRKLLPERHPDVAESLYNYGVALEKTGDRRSAQAAFQEAGAIRKSFASANLLGVIVDRKVLEKR